MGEARRKQRLAPDTAAFLREARDSYNDPDVQDTLWIAELRWLRRIPKPQSIGRRRVASGAFQPAASTCRTSSSLGRPTCRPGSSGCVVVSND